MLVKIHTARQMSRFSQVIQIDESTGRAKLRGDAVVILIATFPLRRPRRGEGQPLAAAGGAADPLQPPPGRGQPHRGGLRTGWSRTQRSGGHDGLARFGLLWHGLACFGMAQFACFVNDGLGKIHGPFRVGVLRYAKRRFLIRSHQWTHVRLALVWLGLAWLACAWLGLAWLGALVLG